LFFVNVTLILPRDANGNSFQNKSSFSDREIERSKRTINFTSGANRNRRRVVIHMRVHIYILARACTHIFSQVYITEKSFKRQRETESAYMYCSPN